MQVKKLYAHHQQAENAAAITSSSDWICWQISGNVWLVVTAGFKNFESSAPLEQCGKVFLLHPQEK